jgi:hypothetical protein
LAYLYQRNWLGQNQPTITTLFKLAAALKQKPSDLIRETEQETQGLTHSRVCNIKDIDLLFFHRRFLAPTIFDQSIWPVAVTLAHSHQNLSMLVHLQLALRAIVGSKCVPRG